MQAKLDELRTRLAVISDLQAAAAVLRWDQQTYMPPGAAEARATQLTTLRKTYHELFIADEIGELLADLAPAAESLESDSLEASLVRVTKREYDRERRIQCA